MHLGRVVFVSTIRKILYFGGLTISDYEKLNEAKNLNE